MVRNFTNSTVGSALSAQVREKNLDVRIYDIPTLAYLCIWIVLIALFRNRIPNAGGFLQIHFILLSIIVLWAIKPPQLAAARFVRRYYAAVYLLIFFSCLNHFIPAINLNPIDHTLIQMDYRLFGQHPTAWLQRWHHPLVTEIMQWSYLGYYFLPLLVPYALHRAGKDRRIDEYITIILTAFYLFYLGNLIFPAYGPRFYLAHLHGDSLQGVWLAERIQHTLNGLEKIQLDAFPSGHAAIIFILMYYTLKHTRKLFWGILPVCVALLFSTVYLRLHYVVDIIAGLMVAVLVLWVFGRWNERIFGNKGTATPLDQPG